MPPTTNLATVYDTFIRTMSPVYQDLFARRLIHEDTYISNRFNGVRKCSSCHVVGHTIQRCCDNITIRILTGMCMYTNPILESYRQGATSLPEIENRLLNYFSGYTMKNIALFMSFVHCTTGGCPTSNDKLRRLITTLCELFRPVNDAVPSPVVNRQITPPTSQLVRPIAVPPPTPQLVRPIAVPPPTPQLVRPIAVPPPTSQLVRPIAVPPPTSQLVRPIAVPPPTPQLVRLNSPHTPLNSPPPSPVISVIPHKNSVPRSRIHIHFDGKIGETKNQHSCPICICDDFDTYSMTTLQCSHRLCTDCFVGLFQADKTRHVNICPYCRAEINVVTVFSHESYYKIASMYLS